MTRLAQFERLAYRLALVCLLVAAGRFGWTLTRTVSQTASPNVTVWTSTRVDKPTPGGALPKELSMQLQTPESIQSAIAAAVGTAKPTGSAFEAPVTAQHNSVTGYLSVQVGPARSELRANGRILGHTPYVGQINCEKGQTVKLDVLPTRGMPRHYEIPCLAGEMRLDEEPPAN